MSAKTTAKRRKPLWGGARRKTPKLVEDVAAVARTVAADMRRMELECWKGRRMGEGAVALMLDGFASRLEGAYDRPPGKEGEMSDALRHWGCEVADDEPGGNFAFTLSTPFEGAAIEAVMFRLGDSGRDWLFGCHVRNNKGIGWMMAGNFYDCGRYVAKSMLRSMALELRRAYCHRGQRSRKRAIARAMAKAAGEDAQ